MTRRKPLRGPLPGTTGAGRTALLRVRVSPEERDAWQAAADLEGVPLSEWVRSRLERLGPAAGTSDQNETEASDERDDNQP